MSAKKITMKTRSGTELQVEGRVRDGDDVVLTIKGQDGNHVELRLPTVQVRALALFLLSEVTERDRT